MDEFLRWLSEFRIKDYNSIDLFNDDELIKIKANLPEGLRLEKQVFKTKSIEQAMQFIGFFTLMRSLQHYKLIFFNLPTINNLLSILKIVKGDKFNLALSDTGYFTYNRVVAMESQ